MSLPDDGTLGYSKHAEDNIQGAYKLSEYFVKPYFHKY
jgi:hypothetical protein